MEKIESRYRRRVLVLTYALLGLLALLPLFCMGDNLAHAPKTQYSDLLQGYDPSDRWAGVCRDIDFPDGDLGHEHDICDLPRADGAAPIRVASAGDGIRFELPATPAPSLPDAPVVEHWETGPGAVPILLAGGGGGWAQQSVSGGGGGLLFFLDEDSDSSSSRPRGGTPDDDFDPGPDGDSDPDPDPDPDPQPDPQDPSVPEPSAGLLFAVGLAAVYRQRNLRR